MPLCLLLIYVGIQIKTAPRNIYMTIIHVWKLFLKGYVTYMSRQTTSGANQWHFHFYFDHELDIPKKMLISQKPNTTADISATWYIISFNLSGQSSLRLSCKSSFYFFGCPCVCSITKCNTSQRTTWLDLLFQTTEADGPVFNSTWKSRIPFSQKDFKRKRPHSFRVSS